MPINVSPDLEKWLAEKVASGVYASADEVVREGLRLLQERDDFQRFRLEALQREIDAGLEQAEKKQTRPFSSDDLKRRVRESFNKTADLGEVRS